MPPLLDRPMTLDRMSADALAFVAAIALPVLTLAALIGLIAGVSELERSRDELIELGIPRR